MIAKTISVVLLSLLMFIFFGCNESNLKSQNYLLGSLDHNSLNYTHAQEKKSQAEREEKEEEKNLFVNESIINEEKLNDSALDDKDIFNPWWLLAIPVSLMIIIFFIRLLLTKQKTILQKLQEESED
ncbi:MAG: hypothetical protein U9N52_09200 [Campylobacterota bacterium]|nr:hypothetical protein [Campylobacterota bacterium]